VAYLDIVHESLRLLEGDVEAADPIARISVDSRKSPFGETLPDEFGDCL
jgi:hypothetical protein